VPGAALVWLEGVGRALLCFADGAYCHVGATLCATDDAFMPRGRYFLRDG
jgi:hypothetical protein